MHFIRKVGVFLAITGFSLLVFLLAASLSISISFGEAKDIKGYLAEGNVYTSVVEAITEQAGKIQTQGENGEQGVDPKVVQAAVKEAFPPQLVQSNAEQFIDGLYNWLDGQSARPDFRLDFTDAKNRFIESVGAQTKQRLASAPQCDKVPEETDPFALQCRPKGANVDSDIDRAVEKLKTDENFLKDPVITADDLNIPNDGGTANVFDQAKSLPAFFQIFNRSPAIVGVLALLTAVLAILLSEQRRLGWRKVARVLLGAGIFLAATNLITYFVLVKADRLLPGQSPAETKLVSEVALPVIRSVQTSLTIVNVIVSAAYVAIAVAIYVILKRTGASKTDKAERPDDAPSSPDVPKKNEPKPPKKAQ